MPELKASGLLETFLGTKRECVRPALAFSMVHKHRSRSYPSVLVKNRCPVGLRSSGTPQAFFGWLEIGENKMESRFQRGDLHPSHKIAPGMDETSM